MKIKFFFIFLILIFFIFSIYTRYKKYYIFKNKENQLYETVYSTYSYDFIIDFYKKNNFYPPVLEYFISNKNISEKEKKFNDEVFKINPWTSMFYDPFSDNDSLTYAPLRFKGILFDNFIIYSKGYDRINNNEKNISDFNSKLHGDTLFFKGYLIDKKSNFLNFDNENDILLREPENPKIIIVYK